jgi:hypothetical protein
LGSSSAEKPSSSTFSVGGVTFNKTIITQFNSNSEQVTVEEEPVTSEERTHRVDKNFDAYQKILSTYEFKINADGDELQRLHTSLDNAHNRSERKKLLGMIKDVNNRMNDSMQELIKKINSIK